MIDPTTGLLIALKLGRLAFDAAEAFSLGDDEEGNKRLDELIKISEERAQAAGDRWRDGEGDTDSDGADPSDQR